MSIKRKSGVLLTEREMKRRYPDTGLASEICFNDSPSLKLCCEILAMNYHIGGGIRYGSILELFGEESTGKTALTLNFAKVTQSLGGKVLWDDAECTFDYDWAVKHGVDLAQLWMLPFENIIEIISDWIYDSIIYWRSKLTHNEPILLVIDSLAVLEAKDAMETAQSDTKAEMGKRSFKMGEMLRKRMKIFAKYGVCCIFINQFRKKIGASKFEDPDTSPMSQPMKYFASQRVGLYRGKRLRMGGSDKGAWVGNIVYVRTKKNKSSIPRDNVQMEFYFREDGDKFGYHKYYGFDELLVNKGIVKRKRGLFYYKGKLIAKGDASFRELLSTDKNLRAMFIKKLNINTVSKTRKELEAITTNLYPVKIKKEKDAESQGQE